MASVRVVNADALDAIKELPDESIDSVVTDPPYELGFMGKTWDSSGIAYNVDLWREVLRVLKPGGHLLAFGGTRTVHRLTCAIEDAGFEIRDGIDWLYGSGFPKSLDVSKAIDKAAGRDAAPLSPDVVAAGAVAAWLRDQCAAHGVTSRHINEHFGTANIAMRWLMTEPTATKRPQVPTWEHWTRLREWLDLPATMDAEVWRLNGNKGTPAPLAFTREAKVYDQSHGYARVGLAHGAQKTHTATAQVESEGFATGPGDVPATPAAQQWQGWGTTLKPAREPIVVARKPLAGTVAANVQAYGTGALNIDACRVDSPGPHGTRGRQKFDGFAANGHDVYVGNIAQGRKSQENPAGRWPSNVVLSHAPDCGDVCLPGCPVAELDEVARFFPVFRYQAKAPTRERPKVDGIAHLTVKPLALMRWLVKLVTSTDGTVLDPFAGSGTTVEACLLEGFNCIAFEEDASYMPLIDVRVNRANATKSTANL